MCLDIEGTLSAHWPIPVFGCECTPVDEESGVKACLSEPWEAHVAAVLRDQIDGALAEAWDEGAYAPRMVDGSEEPTVENPYRAAHLSDTERAES
jgi:hypothetical protein